MRVHFPAAAYALGLLVSGALAAPFIFLDAGVFTGTNVGIVDQFLGIPFALRMYFTFLINKSKVILFPLSLWAAP